MKDTGERFIPSEITTETTLEHWHRYVSILSYIENKNVLDIASGSGYGSFLMAEKAKNVIGVDIDPESINYANLNYKKNNLSYKQGSAVDIPINESNFFDVIISYETIEHITSEDQKRFLSEVKRLLKKDGLFIVSTPNKKTYTDTSSGPKNIFHLKEFYFEEFNIFLNKYFPYVMILGQKIYTSSFIWNLSERKNIHLEEYYSNKKNTKKEPLYFIAICSNLKLEEMADTLFIDLENKLVEQKINSINIEKNKEIEMLKTSISWKITSPLRYIKKKIKNLLNNN